MAPGLAVLQYRSVADWHKWHGHYDDQDSSLSRRLSVVPRRLDKLVSDEVRVRFLSIFAGDGRYILPLLTRHSEGRRPDVVLVELDPGLAAAAERRAPAAVVAATVVMGDAGLAETWQNTVPVDLTSCQHNLPSQTSNLGTAEDEWGIRNRAHCRR